MYFNSIPDGITVAYSNGGTIYQTVGATVEAGVVYTLQVDQGFRKDLADPGVVELVIGNNAPIKATSGVPPTQGSGDWLTYTATYTGLGADVGKSITIDLFSDGAQGDWDNVRLDAAAVSSVSEPGTIPLIGMALIALFAVARRKRVRGDLPPHAVIGI
ncbi:MAG TPA: PEP-CTERM sorting domain-containing protein [Burkholderiales bacterium]|nr:PEP-CTERM sorting domain-containing protein [Burkholderiales bacterium]